MCALFSPEMLQAGAVKGVKQASFEPFFVFVCCRFLPLQDRGRPPQVQNLRSYLLRNQFPLLKPGVVENIASHASPAARTSVFLSFAFPVPSASGSPDIFQHKMMNVKVRVSVHVKVYVFLQVRVIKQ